MTPDYLTLTDDRKVRVELDWDAYANWSALTGADLQGLSNLKSDVKLLKTLAYCGAMEGEYIEGRELGLSEEEFGHLCRLQTIVEFVKIFQNQGPTAEKKITDPANQNKDLSHITFSFVRKIMLGRLRYTPAELGRSRLGDVFDAITGYNEAENEAFRATADLIRHATTLLWNVQVTEESRKEPEKLWPFPWEDPEPEEKPTEKEEAERTELQERQNKILENM